jgi:hypothetical protein
MGGYCHPKVIRLIHFHPALLLFGISPGVNLVKG